MYGIIVLQPLTVLLGALCLSGCQPTSEDASQRPGQAEPSASGLGLHYRDITSQSGIDFKHSIGDGELSNIVESTGGGVALFDYDQDGLLDVYVANGCHMVGVSRGPGVDIRTTNKLYRNLGDGRFIDATDPAGMAHAGYGIGVMVGDYDNDGYPDVYVTNFGPNVLYRNNGDGTFTDVSQVAGVVGAEGDLSVGAAWLDFDNDGLLDLYVGNYVQYDAELEHSLAPEEFPGPLSYSGQPDLLYRNQGDGTFEDVTRAVGVWRPDGRAMGIGAIDYDDDGFVDIYVANDAMENYLFHNEAGQRFTDMALPLGVALNHRGNATSSMTVTFGDYDGDSRVDMFVPDMSYGALYRNEEAKVFTDMTHETGIAVISGPFVGWAAAFIDYDNDGDADIFQVNGDDHHLFGQQDALFENLGDGRFENVSERRGQYFQERLVGRGAAFGDLDNDGDVDAFIANLNDRAVLLLNEGGNQNSWIILNLIGEPSNRDAVGARVRVDAGQRSQVAQKTSSSSYLSQNDHRLHFGLGAAETVDRIEIRWPSGALQVVEHVPARQIVTITER